MQPKKSDMNHGDKSTADCLVVIPARGGSKRLPGKNLKSLGGRSLLERIEDALKVAGIGGPRLLTTDDESIAAAGRQLGWLVPFLRPKELATDDTPTVPVVLHAIDWFRRERGTDPALIMVLQATSPFRNAAILRQGLDLMAERRDADAVVAVRDLRRSPRHVFGVAQDGHLKPLGGNDPGTLFTPNGEMYLVNTRALRRHKTLFPPRTLPVVADALSSVDIDTELDWRMAEALERAGLASEPARTC